MKEIFEKICDICRERMVGKSINQSEGRLTVEYTCTRKNCPRHEFPVKFVEKQF